MKPCTMLICITGLMSIASVAQGAAPQTQPARPAVRVMVDPRVELLSLVFRLAGNEEYSRGRVGSYTRDVEKHFAIYRQHPVVERARRLRETRGVSYDAVMAMAVHITDTEAIKEVVPFDPRPSTLDERWTISDARAFLKDLRQFVKDSNFNGFLREHRALYETSASRLRELLETQAHLEWFEQFFGPRKGAAFTVVPGMLNGGGNYGVRCGAPGGERLYCILGVWQTDLQGLPIFDKGALPTVIHEFTHSYANPIVERHLAELKEPASKLFVIVEDQMRRQAYGDWTTMMRETLVRACVVRYIRAYDGRVAARTAIIAEVANGFLWIDGISNQLADYESRTDRALTLDAYMPRIAAWLKEAAPKIIADKKAMDANRPKVVSITPASGATDVDPALSAIRVVFDRPMQNKSWAVCGGGPHYPESAGALSYDTSGKIFTMPVKLKPGWSYEFWLNSGKFDAFRSREGVPLASVHVTFTTAGQTATTPAGN